MDNQPVDRESPGGSVRSSPGEGRLESLVTRATLVERLHDVRDQEAWQQFFDLYGPMVYRLGRRRRLDREAADALVQAFCARAVELLPRFNYSRDRGTFRSWVLTVALTELRQDKRKEAVRGRAAEGWEQRVAERPEPVDQELEQWWEQEEARRILQLAMDRLKAAVPEDKFGVFQLIVVEGLSPDEVAGMYGMRKAQVALIKHRLLERLRGLIGDIEQTTWGWRETRPIVTAPPSLVILAAGKGSRYGGSKQFEPVGPAGESLMDYAVYDAWRAGFRQAVFVLPEDAGDGLLSAVRRRYEARLAAACVRQRWDVACGTDVAIPQRAKPWGTAHAVLAVEDEVDGPFAVVNADDHYGADSYARLAEFLNHAGDTTPPTYGLVGFAARDTLSPSGPVNRGACRCDEGDWLAEIVELRGLEPDGDGARHTGGDGHPQHLPGGQLVSMNMWGFFPPVFAQLRKSFERFVREATDLQRGEFLLPTAVGELVRNGLARVRVLRTTENWCGLTHRADRERVAEHIHTAVTAGRYPNPLWT